MPFDVKMILKLLLLFCALYSVSSKYVNTKDQALKWPEQYTVEATKMYLTSGLVEHLKYWRSRKFSRRDSNDGAVTEVTRNEKNESIPFGIKYKIHPETTEDELNKMVCYTTMGTKNKRVTQLYFLPNTNDFEEQGDDSLKDIDCVKFTNDEKTEDGGIKRSLWAYYDNTTAAWVPVRYEKQSYNAWHGYFTDHMIWDFYNFEADVDFDAFKIESPEQCIVNEDNDDEEDIKTVSEGVANLNSEDEAHLNHVFTTYKKQFNKKYAHEAEHEMRRSIFYKKLRMIEERNRQNLGYKLALNKMSDRTEAEMKKYMGLLRPKSWMAGNVPFPYTQEKLKELVETLPSEYDARLEGLVGPVSNQATCGSCYTFSTTGAVEGALAKSNGGRLIKLSNQALLDCSWGYGNRGCKGGTNKGSYKWIMKHGLPAELEYGTYANKEGFCIMENMTTTYKIRGFTDVTPFSVEAVKVALVNHGPLAVAIYASDAFKSYDQGILYDPGCLNTKSNHEVLLVGYGEKDGELFWILKNSWGSDWGLGGYIHISVRDNNCGVATEPNYVVI